MERQKIFIPSKKIILFEDAILFVEYSEAYTVFTEEDEHGNEYNPKEFPSRLNIVTKANEVEQLDGYDGAFKGCATQSAVITVRGDEADAIYTHLQSDALDPVLMLFQWKKEAGA